MYSLALYDLMSRLFSYDDWLVALPLFSSFNRDYIAHLRTARVSNCILTTADKKCTMQLIFAEAELKSGSNQLAGGTWEILLKTL